MPADPVCPSTAPRTFAPVLPCDRAGVSLKPRHYRHILEALPPVGWFEVHAENYMGAGGPPHRWLSAVRDHYPLSLHGVGLSIGSAGGLDPAHLTRLATLVDRYEPAAVSEHLAWSSHGGIYFADLLPLSYTVNTLNRVCRHIDQVQTALGRPILLENPSTYIAFAASEMHEVDFLSEIAVRTDCGLLLDVNNVHISATNHGFDAAAYLQDFPHGRVGEIHLAGHAVDRNEAGNPLLIDSHDCAVADPVWSLYEAVIDRAVSDGTGAPPTLIEWDGNLPDFAAFQAEAARADAILARSGGMRAVV